MRCAAGVCPRVQAPRALHREHVSAMSIMGHQVRLRPLAKISRAALGQAFPDRGMGFHPRPRIFRVWRPGSSHWLSPSSIVPVCVASQLGAARSGPVLSALRHSVVLSRPRGRPKDSRARVSQRFQASIVPFFHLTPSRAKREPVPRRMRFGRDTTASNDSGGLMASLAPV